MLPCQHCGKKNATFHVTEIVDNEKREMHLCEDCAREKNLAMPVGSLTDFLNGLFEAHAEKEMPELSGIACPVCGITYEEFRSGGGLGCSRDYTVFRKGIMALLERIHGSTQHKGKVPDNAGSDVTEARKLIQMRRDLNRAIEAEEYEEAARIRDMIHELKKGDKPDEP